MLTNNFTVVKYKYKRYSNVHIFCIAHLHMVERGYWNGTDLFGSVSCYYKVAGIYVEFKYFL